MNSNTDKLPGIQPVLNMNLPWYSNKYLETYEGMPPGIETKKGIVECLVLVSTDNGGLFVDTDEYDENYTQWRRFDGKVIMWTPFPVFDIEEMVVMETHELDIKNVELGE